MKVSCRTRHAAQQVAAISKYKWIYECYIEHKKKLFFMTVTMQRPVCSGIKQKIRQCWAP